MTMVVYVCAYVYVCVCVCMCYVYVYVYVRMCVSVQRGGRGLVDPSGRSEGSGWGGGGVRGGEGVGVC